MKRLFLTGVICLALFGLNQDYCLAEEIELGEIEVKGRQEALPCLSTILEPEEIKKAESRDTGEVLKKVPGISSRRTGLWGLDPSLRGLKEDQVNVLVDGVKVWGACPGRMDPGASQVTADDLELIEVIKGPRSVRHGAGTLGGVINLVTRRPRPYDSPQVHGNVQMGYDGVADGKKGRLSFYGGDKPYDFRLSAGGKKYADYDTPDGEVDDSSFQDYGYAAKLGLNPAGNKRLDLSVSQNLRKDVMHPARPMDSERAQNVLSNIKYRQEKISPWLNSLSGNFYYNDADHTMNNDERANFSRMDMETRAEATTYGGKLELISPLGKAGRLVYGVDYYRLQRDGERTRVTKQNMMGMPLASPVYTYDKPWHNARIRDWGFYCEYNNPISSAWDFTAGGRVDLVQANSDLPDRDFLNAIRGANLRQEETNLSGNLGLTYAINENYKLMAAVGRGVRTADASERYSNFFPSSKYFDNFDYLGNPDLAPEKSLEFDLGASAKFKNFSLQFTLFYNRVDDFISATTDSSLSAKTMGARGVKRYVNVEATLMGGELECDLKVTQNLSLNGNLSYTKAENETTNNDLAQIPPLEGNVGVRYSSNIYWGEVNGRFVDRQNEIDPAFGETETAGFSTFGLSVGVIPFDNYNIVVGIDNIFDKKYAEHLNGNNLSSGGKLLEPGRNVFARLEWEF